MNIHICLALAHFFYRRKCSLVNLVVLRFWLNTAASFYLSQKNGFCKFAYCFYVECNLQLDGSLLLGLSSCTHLQVKPAENPCLVLAKVSPKIRYIILCTFHSATTRKLESSSTHEIGR